MRKTTDPLHEMVLGVAHGDAVYLHECMISALDGLEKLSRAIKRKKIRKKATSYTRKIWEESRDSLKKCHEELISLSTRIEKAWETSNLNELFTLGSYIYENLAQIIRWIEVLQEV